MRKLLRGFQIFHGIFCLWLLGGAWVLTTFDTHILNMLKWPFIPLFTVLLVGNVILFFVFTKELRKIK